MYTQLEMPPMKYGEIKKAVYLENQEQLLEFTALSVRVAGNTPNHILHSTVLDALKRYHSEYEVFFSTIVSLFSGSRTDFENWEEFVLHSLGRFSLSDVFSR